MAEGSQPEGQPTHGGCLHLPHALARDPKLPADGLERFPVSVEAEPPLHDVALTRCEAGIAGVGFEPTTSGL